jgi:hypothetical protein
MNRRRLSIAAIPLLFVLHDAGAQEGAISAHTPRLPRGPYEKIQARYDEYVRLASASCQASRAAVLAKRISQRGPSKAERLALRHEIRQMQLTREETREIHSFRLIAAKYEKIQKLRALRDAREMRPIELAPDPFLDQLAREREERKRRTGNADL